MLDTEEIHRQAERERQKQARRDARNSRRPREKHYFAPAPESLKIFHRIYPYTPSLLFLMLPLVTATIGGMLWFLDKKKFAWMLPYAGGILLIPVIVYAFTLIRELIDYQTYRTWRDHLGFPVNGWDRLGEDKRFPKYKYWDNLIVDVKVKSGTPTDTMKLIDDVMYLYTVAASRSFTRRTRYSPALQATCERNGGAPACWKSPAAPTAW